MRAVAVTDAGPAIERLQREGELHGFTKDALATLVRYVEAVLAENERINLTGAKSLGAALDTLALDALPVARALEEGASPAVCVDLGTGNGLPGVVAALRWPKSRVVLVERRAKKAQAVERCLAAVAVPHAVVVACDGRELVRARPDLAKRVDLVMVRAVGEIAPTTKEAAPWLARGGRIVHWKPGALSAEEREAGLRAAATLKLTPLPDVEFAFGEPGAPRRLVRFERAS